MNIVNTLLIIIEIDTSTIALTQREKTKAYKMGLL
jgi:hypothetical protein